MPTIALLLVLNAAAAAPIWLSTDTAVIAVDKSRPTDGVVLICGDPSAAYKPAQVEATALAPYCLSLVAADAKGGTPVWRQCFDAGRVRLDANALVGVNAIAGGPTTTWSLMVSSPTENTRLVALLRLAVDVSPKVGAAPAAAAAPSTASPALAPKKRTP